MLWKQLEPVHQAGRAFGLWQDSAEQGGVAVLTPLSLPGIDHRTVKRKHHLGLYDGL